MAYDNHIIDQVQSAHDIVDVIGQYLPLKKAGRNFKACCPFHEEKTPSFMVSSEKQIYHCFGCGAGGNVFGFLMQYENLSFPEALRRLAEKAGIALPEYSRRSEGQVSETEKIYQIYDLATQYYHTLYQDENRGRVARDYFQKRGFSPDLAAEFRVGWAPDAWTGLYEFLAKKGFSNELLVKSRLVNRSDKGRHYDVFRNRIMVPIHNLQGKIVAFGGRIMPGSEGPKYLNSPENPVFLKRRELFGLHLAKRYVDRVLPRILVVEGYLDFFQLYEKGFKAAVATLGTALTEEHVALLKRFAEEVVVIFDGDQAGESASLRGMDIFLEGGLNVKLVAMPEGLDPDDFLRERGAEAFQECVDKAQDLFDFKLAALGKRYDKADSLGLIKITGEALDTLAKVASPVLADRYLNRLSGFLNVDENSLRNELHKLKQKQAQGHGRHAFSGEPSPGWSPAGAGRMGQDEVLLLACMMQNAALRDKGLAELEAGDFSSRQASGLFVLLDEASGVGKVAGEEARILSRIQDEEFRRRLAAALSFEWQPDDLAKAFHDCLKSIRKKKLQLRLDGLRRSIADAEKAGDQDRALEYTREYQNLLQQTR